MTRQVIETGNSFVLVTGTTVPGRTSTPTLVRRSTTSLTLRTTRGPGGVATLYRWRHSTNSTVSDSDPKVTSSGVTITISGLSPGTSYWIDVRAENSAGNSSYSGNLATSTTGTAPIDPPPPPIDPPSPTITTDTDEAWCYESSDASDPPSGGLTTRVHTPSGCSRSALSADETRWVYKYTRTRTYTNGNFTSATAWGNGTRVHSPTGSTSTTVRANAGSNVSVNQLSSVVIGGADTIRNGRGATTISWVSRSGQFRGSLSSTTIASPTFNAPTTTGYIDLITVWRKTVTNNGVSDTADVAITIIGSEEPDDSGGRGAPGDGRALGDGTYRLTVGVEIASALRADPNSPAYLSYIEIDGANEKLNILSGLLLQTGLLARIYPHNGRLRDV